MSEVLERRTGSVGELVLNKPAALNALSLEMVQTLHRGLTSMIQDPQIKVIVLHGEGTKAFCAGGDVKQVVLKRNQGDLDYGRAFFKTEYDLDLKIHRSPKPVVVVAHGITMGGGIGLLAGARYRVVTESATLAMPEISIGFFPDVGGSYFLSHITDSDPRGMTGKSLGLFLALTAARFGAGDALRIGLATQVIAAGAREPLIRAIVDRQPANDSDLHKVLTGPGWVADATAVNTGSRIEANAAEIRKLMGDPGITAVDAAFRKCTAATDTWIGQAVRGYLDGSPISAAVIAEQLNRGSTKSLEECFSMELGMTEVFMRGQDFPEGIRARLIDKDQKPQWKYRAVGDVPAAEVAGYFPA